MLSDLRQLSSLTRGRRALFGGAVLALAGSLTLAQVVPLLCGAVIDGVAGAQGGADAPGAAGARGGVAGSRLASVAAPLVEHPWLAALAIVAVTAGAGALAWLRGRLAAQASEQVVRDLRDRLHDHLQRVPCSWLDARDTGDLVQRCSSDVETVRLFVSAQVVEIGRAILMVLLVLPVMLWLDARMALASLVLFPLIFLGGVLFFRRVKARFLEVDEAESAMTSTLQENLAGMRVVRAFGREAHESRRFGAHAGRFADLQERLIRLLALYWASSDLVCGIQIAIPLFAGARWVARGEMSVGALYAFMAWTALLIFPVRQMGRTLTDAGKAVVSLKRIAEVLAAPLEVDPADPAEAPAWAGRIEMRGLSFRHGEGRPVLDGIDLVVEPGQVVALVGPPGCGKSTIVSLLLRMHDPTAGTIRIDGTDVARLPRRAVRRAIATVLQEPFLYSRTVGHNVRVGRSHATSEEIEEAARAASIHDAILAFPDGYDTIVGERGVTLSGGQRQRVVIARTLLEDAPILVLDDALSAVDTRTEARIREAIAARRGQRTCVIIAHRLTTTRAADVVVVLSEGRIVQRGTHEELASIEGPYRRLWEIQSELEDEMGGAIAATGGA